MTAGKEQKLLLWIWLIIMFVALYAASNGSPGARVAAVLLLASGAGWYLYLLWLRRGSEENAQGESLIARGRYVEALEQFKAAAAKRNGFASRTNVASARLMLFEFDEALLGLQAAARWQWSGRNRARSARLAAVCRVLLGHTEPLFLSENGGPLESLARGLLLVRRGEWAEAERVLQSHEINQLGGVFRDLADACGAWCAWELRREMKRLDGSALLRDGRLERLSRTWPELAAFVGAPR